VRRTFRALIGFSVAVTVLVGLKATGTARMLGWSAEAGPAPDDPAAGTDGDGGTLTTSDSGTSTGPASSADPSLTPGSDAPSTSPGASPMPSTSRSPGATTTSPTSGATTTSTAPASAKTYTGAAVAIKTATSPNAPRSGCGSCHTYSISVAITVSGGRITTATAVYSPQPSGESLSDANKANNSLSTSILTKQTWNLGPVSGATYACNAWELSAKDAMGKAGLPV
jgi:uncharacterized protein with FMN-binding domain